MTDYQGKGVCGGVAIGRISVMKREEVRVCRYHTENVEKELARVEAAKEKAAGQLAEIYEKALREVGEANAQIFQAHRMILEDEDYNASIRSVITTQQVNGEYAVAVTSDLFSEMYASMEDVYLKERSTDVKDVSNRVISCLLGEEKQQPVFGGNSDDAMILCADDFTPSETIGLGKSKLLALVTAFGSFNSHTAILARSMNIPAVVGVGEAFLKEIKDGDEAVVNGNEGHVFVNPDSKLLEKMKEKQRQEEEQRALLLKLKGKENITLDGTRVDIYANINGVDNVGAALFNDAGGIGLFRSEFLYLGKKDFPTEEEQFQSYKKVLEGMGGKRVIIRTLDIGADKQADYFGLEREENPAMGLRAIRICLKRPEIFKTQLRALYRASVYGKLSILYPMITSVEEVERIGEIVEEVKKELVADGLGYSPEVETGIMIETPAAAIISDRLAPMVDFFSVGTNDLTQYTLACDRQNLQVAEFSNAHHESVLRLIELTVKNAHANDIRVGICGELAADISLTKQFLQMGIDELSVAPAMVLKLRDTVRKLDLEKKVKNSS